MTAYFDGTEMPWHQAIASASQELLVDFYRSAQDPTMTREDEILSIAVVVQDHSSDLRRHRRHPRLCLVSS